MPDNVISQEVAWNLSQAIIDQIDLLLSSSINNYMKYNLEGCFRNLKGIKMIIIANLSKEEREKFKKKEEALSSVLSGITMAKTGFDLSKQIEFTKKNGKEITQNLEDYSEAIMDTLKKYGYLIPAKETKTNLNN